MNPVNGFTPEGLPDLLFGNMPVQSTFPGLTLTRPQIYFGELTNTDVYVKTNQKEFDYPQGETNSFATYEGTGGIEMGGFFRRALIALDRGDLTKVPLQRRHQVRQPPADAAGTSAIACRPWRRSSPSIPIPYVVVIEGWTARLDRGRVHDLRFVPVRAPLQAWSRGSTTSATASRRPSTRTTAPDLLRLRPGRSGHRRLSPHLLPSLFRDAGDMPPTSGACALSRAVARVQAAVFGLYHMTDRRTCSTTAKICGRSLPRSASNDPGQQAAQTFEPNFVLMKLRASRRSSSWRFCRSRRPTGTTSLAGSPDGATVRTTARRLVYDFPQDAARGRSAPDRSPHRSERPAVGTVVAVEPAGLARAARHADRHTGRKGLLYRSRSTCRRSAARCRNCGLSCSRSRIGSRTVRISRPRSPRCSAMRPRRSVRRWPRAALGGTPVTTGRRRRPAGRWSPAAPATTDELIRSAAKDIEDYQRLTSEGKLGEAGQRLESLKQKLQDLQNRR